jgi:hypothetical protein
MKSYSICQNCCWTHKPSVMLTGYCIDGACDLCGNFASLMMAKAACYCEDIKIIYPGYTCDHCSGLRKAVACTPLLMLKDQPGPIVAYKLVNERDEGPYNGGIKYPIGASVEVLNADTNPATQCAAGINVADLTWCIREWKQGYKIRTVEFTAADIACIPTATDGKFRLFRCKVTGEKDLKELGLEV